ncbi:hypothetical protein H0E87_030775 [Populus deltoides]|uniref:Uncharacterized protein n=1 Tax=Populus deltoides TaxID=3696 RepID=A0A8T2WKY8_POPDE|nr:hypothetical protein H0E87_030775 [Populus deltoides]
MGGIDLCEQREAKTGGEGRSIAVRRPISVMGAIHLLAKRDKSGGISVSVSESLGGNGSRGIGGLGPRGEGIGRGMRTVKLLGGNGSKGIGGTGTERGGDWEGNGNSELLNGGDFC